MDKAFRKAFPAILHNVSLEHAEDLYCAGQVRERDWLAYSYAWRNSASRFSSELSGFEDAELRSIWENKCFNVFCQRCYKLADEQLA